MLRVQDLMLISGMLDQAVVDAVVRKVPPVVRKAIMETQRRVKAAELKAPIPVQVAFHETFCRSDCMALMTCVDYAKKYMERDGQRMDEETERGFNHVRSKLAKYIDEMDAAGEMKGWLNQPLVVPSLIAPNSRD